MEKRTYWLTLVYSKYGIFSFRKQSSKSSFGNANSCLFSFRCFFFQLWWTKKFQWLTTRLWQRLAKFIEFVLYHQRHELSKFIQFVFFHQWHQLLNNLLNKQVRFREDATRMKTFYSSLAESVQLRHVISSKLLSDISVRVHSENIFHNLRINEFSQPKFGIPTTTITKQFSFVSDFLWAAFGDFHSNFTT